MCACIVSGNNVRMVSGFMYGVIAATNFVAMYRWLLFYHIHALLQVPNGRAYIFIVFTL